MVSAGRSEEVSSSSSSSSSCCCGAVTGILSFFGRTAPSGSSSSSSSSSSGLGRLFSAASSQSTGVGSMVGSSFCSCSSQCCFRQRQLSGLYDVGESLGSGAFGEVSLVVDRTSGRRCCRKALGVEASKDGPLAEREVALHSELDHPHIVRMYEVISSGGKLNLCMELCEGGDLVTVLEEEGPCEEAVGRTVFGQIAQAVRYVHSRDIAHRDLKLENFLLQRKGADLKDNVVKLIDFGFAAHFVPGTNSLATMCGTPGYAAPEVFSGETYDERCDIFSCGVILFALLCGRMPFDGDTVQIVVHNTSKKKIRFNADEESAISHDARRLILDLCAKPPSLRPTSEQVCDSYWFEESGTGIPGLSGLAGCCALGVGSGSSPCSRCAAEEVVKHMAAWGEQDELVKASLRRVAYNLPDDSKVDDLRKTFKSLDLDHDGKVTLEELRIAASVAASEAKAAVASCEGAEVDEKGAKEVARLEHIIDSLDAVGTSGAPCAALGYSEFLAAMLMEEVSELPEVACQAAFRSFDGRDCGAIHARDLETAIEHGTGKSRRRSEATEALLRKVDADGDGQIGYEDFKAMLNAACAACGGTCVEGAADPANCCGGSHAGSLDIADDAAALKAHIVLPKPAGTGKARHLVHRSGKGRRQAAL